MTRAGGLAGPLVACLLATLAMAQITKAQTAPAEIAANTDQNGADPNATLAQALVAAYPAAIDRYEAGDLVFRDGTRMTFDDGRRDKSPAELLGQPSPRDQFHWPYRQGALTEPPARDADPGRVRVAAFFGKLYGDCAKGEVAPHLVAVPWVPSKRGGVVRVTSRHGVAEKLGAVSAELDRLPATFDRFLVPSAGGYVCRRIAGTERTSGHGWGIAVDLSARHAHYWRWTKPDRSGAYAYRNAIPPEIVAIFEKHGFIWGGRWAHYDTMHFEYRPELLAGR